MLPLLLSNLLRQCEWSIVEFRLCWFIVWIMWDTFSSQNWGHKLHFRPALFKPICIIMLFQCKKAANMSALFILNWHNCLPNLMLRDEVKHNNVRFSLETDWRAHPFSIYHCILFTPRYMQTKHAYIYAHTHTYTQVNKAHSHTSRKAEPTWPSVAKSVPLSKSYKCILWTTHLTLIKDRPAYCCFS